MEIFLTIAIPTYNRERYLRRALDSILNQYDERIEIIVSDNASTDFTQKMIEEEYPQITYLRNKENIGADKNFLQCYQKAKGKYVWLLGSDDVIIKGTIENILNFLSENKGLSLVFLNHVGFKGEYIDLKHCRRPFIHKITGNVITTDKKEFMSYVKHQLTFMSSFLLLKDAFSTVLDPEKYIGTHFIHTCIAFEATKKPNTQFGIFMIPCVAQDFSIGNGGSQQDLSMMFEIFGKWEKFVLCIVAPENQYNKRQMRGIHSRYLCHAWTRKILRFKAERYKDWKNAFWSYGFPAIKDYPRAWVTILPTVFLPEFIVKIGMDLYRIIFKK